MLGSTQLIPFKMKQGASGRQVRKQRFLPSPPPHNCQPHSKLSNVTNPKQTADPLPGTVCQQSLVFILCLPNPTVLTGKSACRLFQAHLANAINLVSIKLSFHNCMCRCPDRRKGQDEKAINVTCLPAISYASGRC